MATIPGVSDGELIRTTWGDAVADELNTHTVKKTGTQVMTGALTADRVFVSVGTQDSSANALTRYDFVNSQVAAYASRMVSASVTYTNAPGATLTGLTGTLSLPAPLSVSVPVNWQITWNYSFSGHSVGTEYRTRMINTVGGGTLSISGYDHYDAGESHSGVHLVFLGPITTAVSIGFQVELVSASSNTNVAGLVVAVSCPV